VAPQPLARAAPGRVPARVQVLWASQAPLPEAAREQARLAGLSGSPQASAGRRGGRAQV